MKIAIVFAAVCLAAVFAAPPGQVVQTLRQDSDVRADGYQWLYELDNGQKAQESGQLKNAGTEQEAISVSGSFEWVDDVGQKHLTSYTADENGYQPQSDDIPKAPSA